MSKQYLDPYSSVKNQEKLEKLKDKWAKGRYDPDGWWQYVAIILGSVAACFSVPCIGFGLTSDHNMVEALIGGLLLLTVGILNGRTIYHFYYRRAVKKAHDGLYSHRVDFGTLDYDMQKLIQNMIEDINGLPLSMRLEVEPLWDTVKEEITVWTSISDEQALDSIRERARLVGEIHRVHETMEREIENSRLETLRHDRRQMRASWGDNDLALGRIYRDALSEGARKIREISS